MNRFRRWLPLAAVGAVLVTATAVHAQTIAGTVKDATGAVLPGVTVEAASPALIEKVRTVLTDGSGEYKIVNLSPGSYVVSFTLSGFSVVKREGIELTGDFTATVNADLKVGALEETLTVSGATPLVDVQSLTKETVLTRDVLDEIPTAHTIVATGVLIPGVTMAATVGGGRDVGGNTMLQQPSLNFRGPTGDIQRWDGFHLGNLSGGSTGGGTSFYVNDAGMQEVVYTPGGDSVDKQFPGLYIDMVPKDGGNTFNAVLFADYTGSPFSASNLGPDLQARGITNVTKVIHISDFNPGFGGPILKNKLWFYAAYRYQALNQTVVDSYYSKSPVPYLYVPDLSRPGVDNGKIPNESIRLTWQVSDKDKIAGWFTNQNKYRPHYNITSSITPDGSGRQVTRYAQPLTLKWTRTQTSRLLIEGGFAMGRTYFDDGYQTNITPSFVGSVIQANTTIAITDLANAKSFGASQSGYLAYGGNMEVGHLVANYVTGSHAFKAGGEVGRGNGPNGAVNYYTGDVTYTLNNGVPASVTLRIPRSQNDGYSPDLNLFVQDRWTISRATITAGLRYDYFVGYVGAGTLPASRWNAAQSFPEFEAEHWKDFSPRVGLAYDLFGNGKTAVKTSIVRYVAPESNGTSQNLDPQNTIGRTDTRTWNDLNHDYSIFNADGSVQYNELGPTSNAFFGKNVTTTSYDPATLSGYNARGSTVEWEASVQQQVSPRVAVNGGYYFRYLGNQLVTNNTLLTAGSFSGPFCITAPSSPDLPGGGNFPVCGLYDITSAARPLVQNVMTFARNFGGVTDHYMGFDIGATGRFGGNSFIQGGLNGLRRVYDTCHAPILSGTVVNQVNSPEAQFCHQVFPYRPDVKILGSHTFPWDVTLAGTYQLSTGPNITATWNAPNSLIAPELGRNLSAGATATKSIQLIAPGTLWGGYLNETDLRLSKGFQVGRYRIRAEANLYNVFNSDFVNSVNTTFSTTASNQFLRPTGVLLGRLFKIGGQVQF